MKRITFLVMLVLLVSPVLAEEKPLDRRWVFLFGFPRNAEGVKAIKQIVAVAADHGINGAVLSSFGLDSITRWPAKDLDLLREVAAFCKEKNIELIPTGFSAGYGGGAYGHDHNFAAALPCTMLLVAKDGRAVPVRGENLLANGDLEQHTRGRFTGWRFHDDPGKVSFVDTTAAAKGKTSIRFENFAQPHGHGRIMQDVDLRPAARTA